MTAKIACETTVLDRGGGNQLVMHEQSNEVRPSLPKNSCGAMPDNLTLDEREMCAARLCNFHRLSDQQWEQIGTVLQKRFGRRIRSGNGREFLEAVLWVAQNQTSWLDIPKEFGNARTVYIRFTRWTHDGVWPQVIDALQGSPELNACLSALVKDYVEACTLRERRLSMRKLYPRP